MGGKRFEISEKDLNDVIEIDKKLVEISTESPAGENYEAFVDHLENQLRSRVPQIETTKLIIPEEVYENYPEFKSQFVGKRAILLAKLSAPNKPKAHLNGHYDVAKEGDPNQWVVAPAFQPKVVDGRLYGRGACDMKGSIATLLKALEIIAREKRSLLYDLSLSFTPDEESGIYSGLRYMVDQTKKGEKLIDADFFFSLDATQNEISIGKAGTIDFEISVKGRAVHTGRSFTGINAINLAVLFLNELIERKPQIEQRTSAYPANPDLPLGFAHPNLSVTYIHGGFSAGSVPDLCVIKGSRTVLPDESEDPMVDAQKELVNLILAVKQKHQIDADFKVLPRLPAFATSADDPHIKRLRQVASREPGQLFPIACSMGSNDIAWVAQDLGIPTFSRGVQREGCNVHGYNENVPIVNLGIGTEDLVDFLSG
jgi:acetylornithine deacetylase/succinyl-diaminopimelate desuccinylase-like protein